MYAQVEVNFAGCETIRCCVHSSCGRFEPGEMLLVHSDLDCGARHHLVVDTNGNQRIILHHEKSSGHRQRFAILGRDYLSQLATIG